MKGKWLVMLAMTLAFLLPAVRADAPKWFDNSTGGLPRAGQLVEMRLRWLDDTDLDTYIFSFKNGSDQPLVWVNDSPVAFAGGPGDWTNVTKLLNQSGGSNVSWMLYVTDKSGNLNVTPPFVINRTWNPVGGSDNYYSYEGNVSMNILRAGSQSNEEYFVNSTASHGKIFLAKSGVSINWARLKAASITTDMPAITARLATPGIYDKVENNYNASTGNSMCTLSDVNAMVSADGAFKVASLYSDEDNSGAFNAGDNIIFCSELKDSTADYMGRLVDYEISVPRAIGESIDIWYDGG